MYKPMKQKRTVEGVDYDEIRLSSGKRAYVGFDRILSEGPRTDLHIHSTASDGSLSPKEIVRLAIFSNVRTIALTDHDSILGSREFVNLAPDFLEAYSGVEMSALVKSGKNRIHILGYDFDLDNEKINKALEYVDKCSEYNFKLYVRCLKDKFPFIDIPDFEIEKILELRRKTGKNIGRVDIARLLIQYGYADRLVSEFPKSYTKQDMVFEKYLNPITYEVQANKKGLTDIECIRAIKEAGGLVSLAHPSSIKEDCIRLEKRIDGYIEAGLDALEVYHPNNRPNQRMLFYRMAKRKGLLVSGGSDYHGSEVKPDILLGFGRNGNIDIRNDDLSLVKKLRERH